MPSGNAAVRCLTDEERAAIHVRMVQTELMVAALSCRTTMQGRPRRACRARGISRKVDAGVASNAKQLTDYVARRDAREARNTMEKRLYTLP